MLAARRAGALAAHAQQFARILVCRDTGGAFLFLNDSEQRSSATTAWSAGYAKASKGLSLTPPHLSDSMHTKTQIRTRPNGF